MVEAALPEGTGSTTENNQPQDAPNVANNNNVTSETMAYLEERKGNESQSAVLRTDDDMVASTKTLSESNNTSGATGGDRNRILK